MHIYKISNDMYIYIHIWWPIALGRRQMQKAKVEAVTPSLLSIVASARISTRRVAFCETRCANSQGQ